MIHAGSYLQLLCGVLVHTLHSSVTVHWLVHHAKPITHFKGCPCLQASCLPYSMKWLTVVCRLGPSLDFLGRNSSFSGFLSLDQCSLGIGYLRHAKGAWAPSDHDVGPLSFACTREMVGIHYSLCCLYFPQLFFIEVTYFPTDFHFLKCHGIHLKFIITIFSKVSTLSMHRD